MSVCLHDRTTPQRRAGIFRLAPFAVEWRHAASRVSVNSRAFSIRLGLRHPRTEVRLTHRWREMDSNFQYASTVRWHRATDLPLPPTVKRRKTRDDTFRNRKFVDSLRWRKMDSNFRYAGAVNLVVALYAGDCSGRVGCALF